MHFGVKNPFFRNSQLPKIFWSDLVGAIGFLEAAEFIRTSCSSYLEMVSKVPLNVKKCF